MDEIRIRGARTHNLKNINLDLPRDRLIVITGLSGSGKSSLAFDTLYAEGQRRYVESLSAYARQFLQLMEKPDVDHIEGLSPAISIEQKATSHNPRSTVGTVTEIHDYLRLLFARVGTPHCPEHGQPLAAQSVSADGRPRAGDAGRHEALMRILAPVVADRKGEQSTCSPSCARRASCGCASTARCTTSTPCRSWPRTASTPSTWWSTASRCAPTCASAWPNRSRPR
jgi:excinuclease ABC subunit A